MKIREELKTNNEVKKIIDRIRNFAKEKAIGQITIDPDYPDDGYTDIYVNDPQKPDSYSDDEWKNTLEDLTPEYIDYSELVHLLDRIERER